MRFGLKQKVLHAKNVLKLVCFFFPAEILNLKSDKLNVSRSIFHTKYKYKQLLLFKLSSGVLTFFLAQKL